MPKALQTLSVPLPRNQRLDVIIVELEDGKLIARTLDELLPLAPDLRDSLATLGFGVTP